MSRNEIVEGLYDEYFDLNSLIGELESYLVELQDLQDGVSVTLLAHGE